MDATTRVLPARAALAAFLRNPRPQSLAAVAALIGLTRGELRQVVRESAFPPDATIRWQDAAAWVLQAWPLDALVTELGPDADLLPAGLHPRPPGIALPAYLLRAFQVQWKIEPMPHRVMPPATFADYLSDVLHRAIEPMTVDALQGDAEFLHAYHFPETPDDE